MIRKLWVSCFLFIIHAALGQAIDITTLTPLSGAIDETSGLVLIEGRLITHNDSGDDAYLYEFDAQTGDVLRTVFVANATNNDWEDITVDDTHIYIGDFGNNNGNRTDLKIYKLAINDYINAANDTVLIDTISFAYEDQTDFSSSQFSTNFDAEAFISFGDSLYIFSKNWGDNQTKVYRLPKTPGNYNAQKITTYDVSGLITGATYHPNLNEVMLCAYGFLVRLSNFGGSSFFSGDVNKELFNLAGSIQVEAIVAKDSSSYYMSCEAFQNAPAVLFDVRWVSVSGIKNEHEHDFKVYPNPSNGTMLVEGVQPNEQLIVLNVFGQAVFSQVANNQGTISIDVSNWIKGAYFLSTNGKAKNSCVPFQVK